VSSRKSLIYLIRHAESEANASRTFAARVIDPPLSPGGERDAQLIAERLEEEAIERIYASPLRRSVQTAHALASKHQTRVDYLPDLREVNVGVLDGKSSKSEANWDIYKQVLDRWCLGDLEARFEGGESLGEVRERGNRVLGILNHEAHSGCIAVISHAVFLMVFLPLLLGDSFTNMTRYNLPRGSITTVIIENGKAHLEELGNTEHLEE
jgi:broad specificity phosphatase PhoE